jgi:GxxExxY protein
MAAKVKCPRKGAEKREKYISKTAHMKTPLIYRDESYAIIGACFNVYKDKGSGFTEPIYHECLEIEFEALKLPFQSQPQLPLEYRGRLLKHRFQPDFICYDKIIVEIKATSAICDENRSQSLNYLQATGYQLALLVNFGAYPRLQYERLANTSKIGQPMVLKFPKPAPGSEEVYY